MARAVEAIRRRSNVMVQSVMPTPIDIRLEGMRPLAGVSFILARKAGSFE